ncbi:uncharacterized protein [Nicotiana tomentosiformis]|uniref:uncharacterized protein n=1 Tax=Nicotiana tomentosiformis TaxID=4098 RepID=UPI00388C9EFB
MNSKVGALVQESRAKDAEIERLKKRLDEVETERDALRAELAKEKEKNEGILHGANVGVRFSVLSLSIKCSSRYLVTLQWTIDVFAESWIKISIVVHLNSSPTYVKAALILVALNIKDYYRHEAEFACLKPSLRQTHESILVQEQGLDKYAVVRLLFGEEETSIPTPKPVKYKNRKKISTSEDPEPKKKAARKLMKNILLLTDDSVRRLRDEDEEKGKDDSGLVARVKMSIEAPKATESVKVAETPSRDKGVSGRDLGEVPESSRIEDSSHHNEPMEGTAAGADLEPPPPEMERTPQASALHREAFSRSRAELSRYEADLRGLTEERNALKLLCGQKEEEIKDFRADLAKAHQDQTDLIEQVMKILKSHGLDSGMAANISVSQLQQKAERIEQLCDEVEMMKVETLGVERSQLRGMKEKNSILAKKIEELEARLAFELAKAKSEAEKPKDEAEAIVAIYQADAEVAQVK